MIKALIALILALVAALAGVLIFNFKGMQSTEVPAVFRAEGLLPAGYSVQSFYREEERDFIVAVLEGRENDAARMARALPDGVNTQGTDGETALLFAVLKGNIKMVKKLLEIGADPNGVKGRSPLHPATQFPNTIILETLLEAGADPNESFKGETPLYVAAMTGQVDAIKSLVRKNADMDLGVVSMQRSPAYAASVLDRWDVVELLIQNGADWSLATKNGDSVAYRAYVSNLPPNHPQAKALNRIIAQLQGGDYPWPPPGPQDFRRRTY